MGDIFGKYELIKKIARGGMAEVFLACEREGDERTVAIKRLFPHLTEDEETIDMFLDEGRIAAALDHPNIVGIYDLGVADDFLYIAMEYVHGRDLRSILEEGYNQDNFIPIELAASLGAQVAAGLHYAHTATIDGEPRNIVHRDISPQNILLSVDGSVKICDFGIAKAEHRLTHTKAGQVKGKFSYMAPEQIETSEVDARSDVFALGIVLYETTTMTRLFKADTQYEALEKILYSGIEPPTALRAGYPPELEKIVMKALERDPGARFQSAGEMHQELDSWLTQNQASTSSVPLARYVRGLFPELSTPVAQVIAEATGPMQVDADVAAAAEEHGIPSDLDKTVVQEFDREAAMEAAVAAEREIDEENAKAADAKDVQKKDVTEMDEDDLDKALDFALGAPSEADVVISRPTSEAEVKDDTPEYAGEDATMISERVEELAEADATDDEPGTADTVADRPALSTGSKIVPTVTKEPEVPTLGPTTDPDSPAPSPASEPSEPSVDRSPPGAPPPATRSGSVPTRPPGAAKPPPAAESATTRAKAAFEPDIEHADISLDDIGDATSLSDKKTPLIIGVLFLLAVLGFVIAYAMGLNTEGSEMEKEVERTQVDPDMLVVEVAEKRERVMTGIETTPADAAVVVNGMLIERSGGKIPLVKGEKNEVNIYAPGHKPARAFVDGDGSGSPISFTLEPLDEELPEEEKAELDIISEPRGATVWVDGQNVGSTPTTVSDLWTGADHHVYIETEGRFSYVGFIGLVKKSKNEVSVKLDKLDSGKKNYVEVINAAIPRGTGVRWNGDPIGATPGFKNFDRNTYATVELEEPDSVPMRRHIVLEDVGTFELRPFLERMKREKGTITVFVEPMGPEIYVGSNAFGQGPAGNVVLPEGTVKVVLDTAHGREEVAVEVVANTHTRYTLAHTKSGVTVTKKE